MILALIISATASIIAALTVLIIEYGPEISDALNMRKGG